MKDIVFTQKVFKKSYILVYFIDKYVLLVFVSNLLMCLIYSNLNNKRDNFI